MCVSSQLGCAMNCQFCYTAKMGLRKNLTAAQIVEQVVHARRMVGANEVSNVVFMRHGRTAAQRGRGAPGVRHFIG